ncbi:S-layer protein [Candidatus Micrarchaeota archaeon]|nr:S-layer protein [Candidatus Micrarchaeota archaeon]
MKIIREDEAIRCAEINLESAGVLSKDRLKILEVIAQEPMYPAQIAKVLNMQVQTVYYHIRLLEEAELVKFLEYEEKKGAVAKKYNTIADSVVVVLNKKGWKPIGSTKKQTPKLFADFVKDGYFDGKFVLGSPDPHGKYRARGSEYSMIEIAMAIGQYGTFSFPLYSLDTELKEAEKRKNLVLAGGPKVNMLVAEINNKLPINFKEETFDIYSNISKKRYGENVGVVELIENPFSKNSRILLVGGLNHHGTRAAVLSIIKKRDQLEKGNNYDASVIAKIVEGFDEDGDGVVDSIDILE